MTVGKDKKMTKEEFANLKEGQMIVVLVKRGKKVLRECLTLYRAPSTNDKGSKYLYTPTYGLLDNTDVDFLRKEDVERLMDEEIVRHIERKNQLEKLLKEAK